MRQVINAVDEGNLLLIPFDRDELPVNDQKAAEPLGIAVGKRYLVVVRQSFQFSHEASVSAVDALTDAAGQCADARTLEMRQKQRCFRLSIIDAETLAAILAAVALQSSAVTVSFRVKRVAGFAGYMTASCCVFLGVNMFKLEKMSITSYKLPFPDTQNRTLSSSWKAGFDLSRRSSRRNEDRFPVGLP